MTIEEKVEYIEDKLARTLEVLKLFVQIDNGLNKSNTEWLVDQIEELQYWENSTWKNTLS